MAPRARLPLSSAACARLRASSKELSEARREAMGGEMCEGARSWVTRHSEGGAHRNTARLREGVEQRLLIRVRVRVRVRARVRVRVRARVRVRVRGYD